MKNLVEKFASVFLVCLAAAMLVATGGLWIVANALHRMKTPMPIRVVSYETNSVTVTNTIWKADWQIIYSTNFVHRVVDWNVTNYHRVEIPVRVTNTIWMKRYMPPKYPEDWFGYESPHSPWLPDRSMIAER